MVIPPWRNKHFLKFSMNKSDPAIKYNFTTIRLSFVLKLEQIFIWFKVYAKRNDIIRREKAE